MMFYWAKQRISMRVGVFVGACPAEVSTKCAYAYIVNVHDHFVSLHLKRDNREPPSTKLTCETRANAGCRIYIRTKPCSGKAKSSNEDGYGQVSSHLTRNGDPSRLGKWILKSLLYLCPALQLWRGGRSNNPDEATHTTNSRNMAKHQPIFRFFECDWGGSPHSTRDLVQNRIGKVSRARSRWQGQWHHRFRMLISTRLGSVQNVHMLCMHNFCIISHE